jgi:ubiquinone biosynthesis protein
VEGLGRQLDPDLDLWKTAKPFLERWMHEQIGWRGFVERLKVEAPQWANKLPDFPRLLHQILDRRSREDGNAQTAALTALLAEQKRTNRLLSAALLFVGGFAVGIIATHVLAWMGRY